MSIGKRNVSSIDLYLSKPTTVKKEALYTWVIWQFPQIIDDTFCGAVRPPVADYGWFPALIHREQEVVTIHGHLKLLFDTPEQAAAWLTRKS